MFNNSHAKKFFLIFMAFFFSAAYASDPCDYIAGEWKGKSNEGHTFYTCEYDLTVKVEKNGNDVGLLGKLANGNPKTFGRCKDHEFLLIGNCKYGLLSFEDGTKGKVIGTLMSLRRFRDPGFDEANLMKTCK